MQPIITDSNSVGSKSTDGFTSNARSAPLERGNDDYIDLVLRKEINLWFQKNSASENGPGIIEPASGYPAQDAPSVINLGYSGE